MRVQRTRSSASPPHSPLTRGPLGGSKVYLAVGASLVAFLFAISVLATGDTLLVPTPAPGQDRLAKPLVKGVEMYSWRLNGIWHFSLLVGTNRNKTRKEVTDPRATVLTLKELKIRLAALARGEEVFWSDAPDGPSEYLGRTDAAELAAFCKANQVALHAPY
jgi:hypothetical protein